MDRLMFPSAEVLFNKAANAMPLANTLVYISGPVSGATPESIASNLKVFEEAQRLLLSMGCDVFNPALIQGPIDPLKDEALWQYYMHFCVRALPECDSIFMLPGWQNSKGAKWEHRIADMLGLPKFYAHVPDHETEEQPESARDVVGRAARARGSDSQ
jgi:hypothetical protein